MRKAAPKDLRVAVATAVLAGAVGFLAAAILLDRPDPADDRLEVLAECGFAAGEDVRGSTLRLRCGLEQAEIERLFADTVAGLGFDGIRDGQEPTEAQIAEAGQRLGLTVAAVAALIAEIRPGADDPDAPVVGRVIEVAVSDASQERGASTAELPAVSFATEGLVVGKPETDAEARLLDRIRAKCGAAVGASIEGSLIEVTCGPEPAEVQALIDRFVAASGVDGIRDALAQDEAARQQFIAALGASFGIEDALVAGLLADVEASDIADDDAGGALDAALRARMQRALRLLRIGQTGDALRARQAEIAGAAVAGDIAETERLVRETGEMLRPLADDLAPETPPPLVAAARRAEAAARSIEALDFAAGIEGYVAAADAVRDEWPLIARGYELALAVALTDDRALPASRAAFTGLDDAATGIWLETASGLRATAIDLGLAAAGRLGDRGDNAVGDDLPQAAATLLASLAPLVTAEDDPPRYVAVNSMRAWLLRWQAIRTGDIALLEAAEVSADAAIRVAEQIGEDEHVRYLTDWGLVQLELGSWTGDAAKLDAALEAFQRVAAASDPETDIEAWASAQNNVAAAQGNKARLLGDPELLAATAETFRGVARRVDPATDAENWALYTRNLAKTLVTLAGWQGSTTPAREAIGELEKLRAFEAERPDDLAATDTIAALARAWWQTGYLDRDPATLAKAAALMGEAAARYDPVTAARPRVVAQLSQGDIHRDAGELASDPGAFAAAAAIYAQARATADATGQRQLYVTLTLRQAGALARAAALGAAPDGAEDPAALVAEAVRVVEEVPPAETSPDWERLGADAARLRSELAGSADR